MTKCNLRHQLIIRYPLGAPYYAGQSALKYGADLSYIFCAKEAAIPIKSYSPELMVTPFYENKLLSSQSRYDIASIVEAAFPRIHSLVIGPGLGRDPTVLSAVSEIISSAVTAKLP